ncbi:MAG: TerC family protein [Deltaproteobacteria bacterium]|nr:MAG: TerC family protein [Deltaproteobacteria bacterium]
MYIEFLINFITLIFLEIILGIDNILFLSLVSEQLPVELRDKARKVGLLLAMVGRISLLCFLTKVMTMDVVLVTIGRQKIFWKDSILMIGGFFLIYKGIGELLQMIKLEEKKPFAQSSFKVVLLQILMLDIVFSLDSIVTAIGLRAGIISTVIAIILSVIIMIILSKNFILFLNKYPSMRVIALCFLTLIGCLLVCDSMHINLSRTNVYFALWFSFVVEIFNIKILGSRQTAISATP